MSGPFLQQGDEGPSVSALQLALAVLGFDVGTIDGVFGDATATAVKQFQKSQGVAATGGVDEDTWALLGGQSFDPSQVTQISAEEFPSIARAIHFGADIDSYLQDLGIDSTSISDDEEPVG
jgi:peptidoglycan hydrolase-like protein with peptidoglycan-binding domain